MEVLDERAVWTTAFVNDLPDSSFLYIEDGGSKDSDGKTTPRTLRHFPYKDASGKVDLPHLRNALSRIPQSKLPDDVKARLTKKAQKILAEQGSGRQSSQECLNCGHAESSHDTDGDGDCGVDGCDCGGYVASYNAANGEIRYVVAPIQGVEVRDPTANPDNTWTFSGYAAVFDQQTTLYDGKFLRVTEDIAPSFFDRVLRTQALRSSEGVVHFNYGHDMLSAVAATDVPPGQPGWLDLKADSRGLFYLAKASRDDVDARRMAIKMRDGVLKQASFAFTIDQAETVERELDDGTPVEHRRLLSARRLYDVCATPQGAYAQATSQLRSYAAAIGQLDLVVPAGRNEIEGHDVRPDFGGVIPVVNLPERRGSAVSRRLTAQQLQGIRRHARRS